MYALRTGLIWFTLLLCAIGFSTKLVANDNSVPDTATQATAPSSGDSSSDASNHSNEQADLELRVQACTACHGDQGRATQTGYIPRIAGKPMGYLFNQLVNFRDGYRQHEQMTYLLNFLSDDYLWELASYFSARHPPLAAPTKSKFDAAQLELGERIAKYGRAGNSGQAALAACTACHGSDLNGYSPAVPGLLGLPRHYITAQLEHWRLGQRQAAQPDCMADIARRLSSAETQAVSAWLAAQPLPVTTSASAKNVNVSLLENCGSHQTETAKHSAAVQQDTDNAIASEVIKQGEYLARLGNCAACHTTRSGPAWAGGRAINTPAGVIYSSNISPDATTGIGSWTSDDFWRAMHEGRSPNGSRYYPAFPYEAYTKLSRADSDALFAYLQNLPAVSQTNRSPELRFPFNQRGLLSFWQAANFTPGSYEYDATASAEWNRGAYLVTGLGHCQSCHQERNWWGMGRGNNTGNGGMVDGWHAPSLHNPAEAGLQHLPTAQAQRLLQTGRSEQAIAIGPMAEVVHSSLQHYKNEDIAAVVHYLQSLPVRDSEVSLPLLEPNTSEEAVEARMQLGGELYQQHCQNCHGSDGRGLGAASRLQTPIPLAANREVNSQTPLNLIRIVLYGAYAPSTAGNPRPYGMPPFVHTLSNTEVAAVLSYLRQSWGNQASAISARDVERYGLGGALW